MNAQQTLLSKIREGDWILAGMETSGPVSYARPKTVGAKPHQVADVYFERDEWSGKVYTLTLDDGRKTEPRYGTAHVYLTEAPPTHVEVDGVTVAETRHIQLPAITDEQVLAGERCPQCKGYGVVRKYGRNKGERYKTAKGADEATAKGNSELCPVCKGAALVAA